MFLGFQEVLNDDEKMFLIEQVKAREIIYNKAERNHLNLDLIGKAWLAIQIQFRLRGLDVSGNFYCLILLWLFSSSGKTENQLALSTKLLQTNNKEDDWRCSRAAMDILWGNEANHDKFYYNGKQVHYIFIYVNNWLLFRYSGGFVDGSKVKIVNNDDYGMILTV